LDCPTGKYNDGKGEFFCKNCNFDTYSGTTKATSNAQCKECGEQRTTSVYLLEDGNGSQIVPVTGISTFENCLCKRDLFYQNETRDCLDCPPGGDCTKKDGVSLVELNAKIGFWRPDPLSLTFSDCSVGFTGMD